MKKKVLSLLLALAMTVAGTTGCGSGNGAGGTAAIDPNKIPYYLKQRIAGDRGHLSNESAGKLLGQVLHDNMKAVFLGHLSKENNYAELAYETVKLELMLNESPYKPGDFPMWVASRDEQSECVAV